MTAALTQMPIRSVLRREFCQPKRQGESYFVKVTLCLFENAFIISFIFI